MAATIKVLNGMRKTNANFKKMDKILTGIDYFDCEDIDIFVENIGERHKDFICQVLEVNEEEWEVNKIKICVQFLKELLIFIVYDETDTMYYQSIALMLDKAWFK